MENILGKSLLFLKMHFLAHLTNHIQTKSSLRHLNTAIGEHGHVALKADFKQTDGRNFEGQVSFINKLHHIYIIRITHLL